MSVGKTIKNLRNQKGISQVDLASKIDVSKQTLYKYENEIITNIPSDKIESLATELGTTPAHLMGWDMQSGLENHPIPLGGYEFTPGKYRIPIVATVAAGEPIYSEENVEGWIDYDKDPRGHVFACRIKGDSMSPRIQNGDIIIVDQEADFEDGDIVLVTVNGNDGTCKRFKKYSDSIALLSLNPSYEPMIYTTQEVKNLPVEIKGKVVEFRAMF